MSKSKEFVLSVYPGAEAVRDPGGFSKCQWSIVARSERCGLANGYATERTAWEAAARRINARRQAETNKVVAVISGGAVEFVDAPGAGEPRREAALYALERKCESDAAVAMRLVARLKDELARAEQRAADAQDALTVALQAIAAARANMSK